MSVEITHQLKFINVGKQRCWETSGGRGGSEKGESTEDAKKGERGQMRARDLWVIYALADSIVLFSFMQTPNG